MNENTSKLSMDLEKHQNNFQMLQTLSIMELPSLQSKLIEKWFKNEVDIIKIKKGIFAF